MVNLAYSSHKIFTGTVFVKLPKVSLLFNRFVKTCRDAGIHTKAKGKGGGGGGVKKKKKKALCFNNNNSFLDWPCAQETQMVTDMGGGIDECGWICGVPGSGSDNPKLRLIAKVKMAAFVGAASVLVEAAWHGLSARALHTFVL